MLIESDGSSAQALFSESIPSADHALFEVARLQRGKRIMVFGTGGIGLAIVYLSSHSEFEVAVVGRKAWKLERAKSLGATIASGLDELNGGGLKKISGGGFDAAFEATGVPSVIEQAIRSIRPAGQVVVVGYPRKRFQVPGRRFMW